MTRSDAARVIAGPSQYTRNASRSLFRTQLAKARALRHDAVRPSVCSFVSLSLLNLFSRLLRGSTCSRAGAFRIVFCTLVCVAMLQKNFLTYFS